MQKDYEQAYYHAINIAFLDLIASPPNSKIPPQVQEMARRAQDYCALSPRNSWQIATEGEAELIHGDLKRATVFYIQAISMAESPRAIYSMYSQAIRVASRTHGKSGAQRIEEIFGIDK
jgi:hypothetical protein